MADVLKVKLELQHQVIRDESALRIQTIFKSWIVREKIRRRKLCVPLLSGIAASPPSRIVSR